MASRYIRRAFKHRSQKVGMIQNAYRARDERRKAKAYFVLRRLLFTHIHVRGFQEVRI